MARIGTIQASFAQGEVSDRLFGRVDIAQYQLALAKCENFIVRPEGGLMMRHGTRFGGESRNHAKKSRLIPFIVSETLAYMCEFGDLYVRFWNGYAPVTNSTKNITNITKANPAVVTSNAHGFANGDRVVITGVTGMGQVNNREFEVANQTANTFELLAVNSTTYDAYTSGGTASRIYQVTTPYLEADIFSLNVTQSADVLYIVHPSYAPRTLTRASATSWTLAQTNLSRGPFATLNADDTKHVMCTVTGSNYDPGDTVTLQSNAAIFAAGHVGGSFYIEERYLSDISVAPWAVEKAFINTIGTQISSNGNVYELVDNGVGTATGMIAPSHLEGEAWDSPTGSGSTNYKKWRYLHSRFALMDITGFTDSKTVTATLRSRLPNGLSPNSLVVSNAVNSGGRIKLTVTGHGYGVGDYVNVTGIVGTTEANGDWRIINVLSNSFELEGSAFVNAYVSGGNARRFPSYFWRFGAFSTARGFPNAVAIHEQRLCYANTLLQPFGFWASKAGDYGKFLPGTKDDDAIDYNVGSNQVDPIRWLASMNDLILGTLSQEQAVYGGGLGDPITPTNTRIVPQSSEGSNGVNPARAGSSTIFVNRAGRKVFALRYQGDANGYISEDLIELAEQMTTGANATLKQLAWAKNPLSVLWCLRNDGTLISLTYRPEQRIVAWARHPMPGATVESIGVIPSPDGTTDDLWMIVNRTINGSTKRYVEFLAAPFEPTSPTDKNLMGFMDCALRYSGAATSSFSGLFHLEGQTVRVVANGARHPDVVVTGGKIALEWAATNVWVGCSYTALLRTLRPEAGAVGTAQGKLKRIAAVTVRVRNALGGKVRPVGPPSPLEDDLVRRDMADPMDASSPLYTGDVDAKVASEYDTAGQIEIFQDEPFPLDVIAIMPLNSVNER